MRDCSKFAMDAYYGRHFNQWIEKIWPLIRHTVPPELRYRTLTAMRAKLQEASRIADGQGISDASLAKVVINDTTHPSQASSFLSRVRRAYGTSLSKAKRFMARILGMLRLPKV
jgi:predicted DNA-binding protein (UPF0278 family)